MSSHPPPNPVLDNGGRPNSRDAKDCKKRNVIERCFNGRKHWRAIASRYEKHAIVFRGGIILAAIVDWQKHL